MYLRHCRRCNHLFFFSLITRLLSFSLIPQKGFQNESHMTNSPKQHSNKDRQGRQVKFPAWVLGTPPPLTYASAAQSKTYVCAFENIFSPHCVYTSTATTNPLLEFGAQEQIWAKREKKPSIQLRGQDLARDSRHQIYWNNPSTRSLAAPCIRRGLTVPCNLRPGIRFVL